MTSLNLAARAGRWSAAHWKTAVALWVAFVAVAVGLGTAVGTHKLSLSEQSTGETARQWRNCFRTIRKKPRCSRVHDSRVKLAPTLPQQSFVGDVGATDMCPR